MKKMFNKMSNTVKTMTCKAHCAMTCARAHLSAPLCNTRGEGYIDTCVLILCAMLVIALAVKVLPVYVAKQQLDTFAAELVREAEITGRVGSETTTRAQVLSERLEIDPDIRWSRTGRIQLNEEVTVTLTMDVDIGFGGLGSFPIELTAQASGRSEVYWK